MKKLLYDRKDIFYGSSTLEVWNNLEINISLAESLE